MIKGKTKTGFEYCISDASLENYELLDAMADVDKNPLMTPRVVSLLLGDEQKNRLLDHVRVEDGTVPIAKVQAEILDIMGNSQKNS